MVEVWIWVSQDKVFFSFCDCFVVNCSVIVMSCNFNGE